MTRRNLIGLVVGVIAMVGMPGARADAAAPPMWLVPVLSGLSAPVLVTNAKDLSNRLFIVEQAGIIKVLQPGQTTPTVFLDITTKVLTGGERGLLGLAFHPEFSSNRRFFVHYSRKPDGAGLIAEYQASLSDPNSADPTENPLLEIPQPFGNHNGGMVEFGPDGFLYIAKGDGGSGNDPGNRAQDISLLLGKILRIDVDTPDGAQPYSSPTTNPFFGATPGADEIYAYGVRNPWRFSFDRATGELYVGDVGQGGFEEIDIVVNGGNYGWRIWEGAHCTGIDPALCNPTGFVFPIAEYGHTGGRCSVTGGYVYRGTQSSLPLGSYLFADYCTGEIFVYQNGTASVALDTGLNISSFGEDEAGEIYVVGHGGTVQRIVAAPAATSVVPNQGARGGTVTVTINGSGFAVGATVNAGAGITVTNVGWLSMSQLTATLTIASGAALGARDVTVTNPDGGSGVLVGGFTVVNPSALSLTLTYNGKLRDRVGQGNTALAADGLLDGTLTAALTGGGGRTVTKLALQSSTPGTWDTTSATAYYLLGVTSTLDGPLLNAAGTMAVNFAVADGGSFVVFASDAGNNQFVPGRMLTLTATLSDGATTTATTTVASASPSSMTLVYEGKLRDRVGQGNTALTADGLLDGTLTATLSASGGRTVTGLLLKSDTPGSWDTASTTAFYLLGAASTLDGALLNAAGTMAVSFAVADGGSFVVFASDPGNNQFVPGRTLTLTATFSDGATATATTTVTSAPAPTLTLAYNGKLRDRVGQGNTALGADGAADGTLTVTLSASGSRTVTGLSLQGSAPGTWDTTSATAYYLLGAAGTLDGALLNAASTMAVSFAVADGGSFVVFASDAGNNQFAPGRTLTLTATFSDGTTATATTTVASVPPATLTLAYNGRLRDRVGQGNTALGTDGALDGTLTATLSASGGRTVTGLMLQSDAPGTWDTSSGTAFWLLGAASTLDGALLNAAGTMAVSFAVANGGSFVVFASDGGGKFVPGRTLTLTATFSDGSSATAATTVSAVTVALTYNGRLRDRVGPENTALGPNGTLDGTLTATLTASGGRTVTALQLQSNAPGTWDTTSATAFWLLGAASTLDGVVLNAPGTMAVNFAVADGGTFLVFADDATGFAFTSGRSATLTATFSDGSTATASTTIP